MKYLVVGLAIFLTACASNKEIETVTVQKEFSPHLWSDHKLLKTTSDLCATKGESILSSLGFSQVVRNGTYVYGNFSNNRAAIKCVEVPEGTFVYAAVAGPKVEVVRSLRNEIFWQL
ncbi:hypothetical protein [Oceanobacter mangrovi]|uniref:hypothetical protein n=1 Tax=Oceanobacter mangrovi TaxID=2862510 RepID=UPI001C8D5421|nr:hypothetical protein [Oceanobacter mangrovi]